jgi:hypothetical protein
VDWSHLAQDKNNKQAVLGALVKLRKASRLCLSVRMELGSLWADIHEIL